MDFNGRLYNFIYIYNVETSIDVWREREGRKGELERQTDRQTDRQTQTGRQTDRKVPNIRRNRLPRGKEREVVHNGFCHSYSSVN